MKKIVQIALFVCLTITVFSCTSLTTKTDTEYSKDETVTATSENTSEKRKKTKFNDKGDVIETEVVEVKTIKESKQNNDITSEKEKETETETKSVKGYIISSLIFIIGVIAIGVLIKLRIFKF